MSKQSINASRYITGLMQSYRPNMERMDDVVKDCNYQSLHHFISEADWEHEAVLRGVAQQVNARIGGGRNSALLIDETGCAKKGKHSVGVGRQWLGRIGKVDNGQVFVCAGLSRGKRVGLIDFQLFLPNTWARDEARCEQAGVPKEMQVFRTKPAIALEMVKQARTNGVEFGWVGADGLYGNDPAFLRALDQMGETFMIDIHSDQQIWLEDPKPYVPARRSARGRCPTRLTSDVSAIQVRNWVKKQPESAWVTKTIRHGTKGEQRAEFLFKRVWLWDRKEKTAKLWWLIVRREIGSRNEIKYSLSNAPAATHRCQLVRMQAQRYWIERAFQDAKSHAGFASYQVRGWKGLHHHIALVFLALLFLLEYRISLRSISERISCGDIVKLLRSQLSSRQNDPEYVAQSILGKYMKLKIVS